VDLVAAIVAEEAQGIVAEAVRHELEAQASVQLLDLGSGADSGRLTDPVVPNAARPRAVYFWGDVDAAIEADPEGFEHAMDELCSTIVGSGGRPWGDHPARRAVLIGGNALLAQLDRLADCLKHGVRYRYILVQ
jgi:hypothetical protein